MNKLRSIFLIGPMGAGKTTVGRILAKVLDFDFVDSDVALEQQVGYSIKQLVALAGETAFRTQEALLVQNHSKRANIVLATGGGCVTHAQVRDSLLQCGIICYLKVSVTQQLLRLQTDQSRALLPRDLTQRSEYLHTTQMQRKPLYESLADITVETDCLPVEAVCQKLLEEIQKHASNR